MANRVSLLRSRPYADAGAAAVPCVVIEREPAASDSAVSDMSGPGDLPRIEGLRQLRANCATEWEWNGLWRAVAIAAAADLTMIEADRLRTVDGWELALAWLWGRAACPGDRRDAEITDEINFLIDGLNRGDLVATATRNKSRTKTPAVSPVTTNGDVPADYQAKLQAGPTSPASTAVINRARRGSAAADSSAKSELAAQPAIAGRMQVLEEKSLKLSEIRPSPENPREDWDEAFLRTLGESLRDNGQLVPVTVRTPGPDGVHEIVDGETRYRAAKLVGLTELRVSIIECTDAEAALQRVLSYRQRRDLNPIEEARGLELLLSKYGCSQRELEKKIGISQGQISNRLRLLKLPKTWQKRITAGEITGSAGRTLAAWSDVPELFKELDEVYKENGPEGFCADITTNIRYALREVSVELSGDDYNYMTGKSHPWKVDFEKFDEKARAELMIKDVPTHKEGETQPRAFNKSVAEKLVTAAKAAAKAKAEKNADKREKTSETKTLTAAEKRAKEKRNAELLDQKRARWLVAWLQLQIVDRLPEANDAQLLAYTMHFVCSEGHYSREQILEEVSTGKKRKKLGRPGMSALEMWAEIAPACRGEAWVELLQKWVGSPTDGFRSMLAPDDVAFIAKDLGVDVVKDWDLTAEFLELHTTDQLRALAAEWKLDPPEGKRSQMIEWLRDVGATKPCPKAIAELDVTKAH